MNFKINQKDAVVNLGKTNKRWYKSGIDVEHGEEYAIQRINTGIVKPIAQNFKLNRDSNFFAIGSCFARGIEKAMENKGLSVLSISDKFKSFELKNNKVTGLGFTNKYTIFSILNQLEWSLGVKEFPMDSLIDLDNGLCIDPHTNPTLKLSSRERTIERRNTLNNVVSEIKNCSNIIITLGLNEVWYDKVSKSFLNITPTSEMQSMYPNRYEFCVSGYDDNYSNLERVYNLLNESFQENFNLIITVSPVPLLATFSNRDIVIANTYSKSLLRTAAESLSFKYDNVHYFPSYEMVINSKREDVWDSDGRHVKGAFVNKIMNHFITSHLLE